jgi:hypothetical protein
MAQPAIPRPRVRWPGTVSAPPPSVFITDASIQSLGRAMSTVESRDLTRTQQAVLATLARLPEPAAHNRVFFEKVLFLLSKSVPQELQDLEESFEPYKYGPYSEFLDEQLLQLQDLGLIEDTTLKSEGRRAAGRVLGDRDFAPVSEALSTIMDSLKGFTVDDLVFLVYRLYPDFTKESAIRQKVKSSRLEHYSVDVDELPEGGSFTVTSDKGSTLNVRKQGDKLLLKPVS